MEQASTIGIDLAKHSFQLHGAAAYGSVVFRKKLTRTKVLGFLASQPRCVVAMEACASSHYWGRETEKLGHEIKLIPPIYVKPFVKRQKNDTTDTEAICEAAQRPTMTFVTVKGEEQQAQGMVFRTRVHTNIMIQPGAARKQVADGVWCSSTKPGSGPAWPFCTAGPRSSTSRSATDKQTLVRDCDFDRRDALTTVRRPSTRVSGRTPPTQPPYARFSTAQFGQSRYDGTSNGIRRTETA